MFWASLRVMRLPLRARRQLCGSFSLSNRMFTEHIDPAEDRIHSAKDDEWNKKILEFFETAGWRT